MNDRQENLTIKSFENKIQNSKEILEKLNDNEISLSDAMKLYKEGLKKLKEAEEMLENAEIEFIELNKFN